MKKELSPMIEPYRITSGPYASDRSFGPVGAFRFPRKVLEPGKHFGYVYVLAADGERTGWEHVSVSIAGMNELPSWDMMERIKRIFWRDDECAFQFHPPASEYIDNAEVLHLWRPTNAEVALPPPHLVGVRTREVSEAKHT